MLFVLISCKEILPAYVSVFPDTGESKFRHIENPPGLVSEASSNLIS